MQTIKQTIDHCSISWTVDEALNTWHGTENITVQNTIISQPLHKSIHEKGAHGYGASLGGKNCSYIFNLFSSAVARNPSIGGNYIENTENVDFSNNVIFNYAYRTCDGKSRSINITGNYYKPGPASTEVVANRIVKIDNAEKAYHFISKWYIANNIIERNDLVNKNNIEYGVEYEEGSNKSKNILLEPCPVINTKHVSAKKAYKIVLKRVGAIKPCRDSYDELIIAQVKGKKQITGTGIIDTVEQAGGWPNLVTNAKAAIDTDKDGMPDEWEVKNKLNPDNASDVKVVTKSGYTNLEHYINSLI